MYDLFKKVERVWDKIGAFGEAALERIWIIAKKVPGDLKFNEKYLKYVGDLEAPTLGEYFATSNTYSYKFKEKFPEVADNIGQVHHAIPQAVINKYPNLGITQDQMHSFENLRGIPGNGSLNHQAITNIWSTFYIDYPNATFQQILDKAKDIDDQFGHLFMPPIR